MSELLRDLATELSVVMIGHMGAKDGPEYDDAVREWQQSFLLNGVEGNLDKSAFYNRIVFLRNTNLRPYTDAVGVAPGTRMVIGKMPIFHAAVVFLWDNELRWVYLFNTDADLDTLQERFPYQELPLQDGRKFGDVAIERGIKCEFIDANEPPEKPMKWLTNDQYHDYGFIAMPCWMNQEMRDWYCRNMECLVAQNLGQLIPVSYRPAKDDGQKPMLDLPQVYYIINVPGSETVVGSVASWTEDEPGEKTFYLVQHDVVPNEDALASVGL